MKRLNLIITVTLLATALLDSCSKSSDDSTPKTKTELLTQASWKFSTATVGGFDVSGQLQTCQKDNLYFFAAAGTGTLDEGSTKCNSSDPQTIPFTWNFETNETILNVSTVLISGGGNKFTIVSLSETQLVVSQNITILGSSQTAVVTFIH
jgi:hypothetical protein